MTSGRTLTCFHRAREFRVHELKKDGIYAEDWGTTVAPLPAGFMIGAKECTRDSLELRVPDQLGSYYEIYDHVFLLSTPEKFHVLWSGGETDEPVMK